MEFRLIESITTDRSGEHADIGGYQCGQCGTAESRIDPRRFRQPIDATRIASGNAADVLLAKTRA